MRLPTPLALALDKFVPSRISSRAYLSRQLEISGAPRLPIGAIRDLADHAVRLANFVAGPGDANRHEYLTTYLKGRAASVAALLSDQDDTAIPQLAEGDLRELVLILTKHGINIPRPGMPKNH